MAKFINRKFGPFERAFTIPCRQDVRPEIIPKEGFPDIKDLAKFSVHVYEMSDSTQTLPFHTHEGWNCVAKGVYSDGYCGAAYQNDSGSHIIIAHGGSQSLKDYKTDYYGVYKNQDTSQVSTALAFTQEIVNCYHDKVSSISVTGHSLGGWLAQICALFIEFTEFLDESRNSAVKDKAESKTQRLLNDRPALHIKYRLHVVTFESPGCKSRLKKILGISPRDENLCPLEVSRRKQILSALDITITITNSNIVNTFDEHVGYLVHLWIERLKLISWLSTHKSERIVNQLNDPKSTFREVHRYARRCEHELGEKIKYRKWYLSPENICRMNVLNDFMLGVLGHVKELYKWKNENADQISNDLVKLILDQFDRNFNGLMKHFLIENRKVIIPWNQLAGIATSTDYPRSMDEFVSRILYLFRTVQKSPNEIISQLSGKMREITAELSLKGWEMAFLETASSRYLQNIPTLKNDPVMHPQLRNKIREFLASQTNNFLKVLQQGSFNLRPLMTYVIHFVKEYYTDDSEASSVLYFNIAALLQLNLFIDLSSLFTKHPELRAMIIECDLECLGIMQTLINGLNQVGIQSDESQKMIIICSNDQNTDFKINTGTTIYFIGLELSNETPRIQFSTLVEASQRRLLNAQVMIHGNEIILAQNVHSKKQFLFGPIDSAVLDLLFSPEDICQLFIKNEILLAESIFPDKSNNYISRTFCRLGSELSEEMILKLNERCTVLADVSGTGKSTALVNLFYNIRNSNSARENVEHNWTIFIDLELFATDLNILPTNEYSFLSFLVKAMGAKGCSMGKNIFEFCLKHQKNINFFMDSFEQISKKGKSFIVSLILDYLIPNNCRVWIATDNKFKNDLENKLGIVAVSLKKISDQQFVQYMCKEWLEMRESKVFINSEIVNLANNFASYLLINSLRVDTFLELKILTFIHFDGFQTLTSMHDPVQTFPLFAIKRESRVNLWEEFVSRKYKKYLQVEEIIDDDLEKETCTNDDICFVLDEIDIVEDVAEIHERAAFLHHIHFYYQSKPNFVKSLKCKECTELSRVGICEATLEWKRDIRVPRSVLYRIAKRNQNLASTLDVIVITLIEGWYDNHKNILTELIIERFNVQVIFGDELIFREVNKFKRDVHWFIENLDSQIEWKETAEVRIQNPENIVNYPIASYNFRFCHQNIADYLTAKFLVKKLILSSAIEFLNVHYKSLDFLNVWNFMSILLGPKKLSELERKLC